MRARMPYVQLWKGSYRFRRKVPLQHRQTVGKPEWIRPLGSKHRPIRDRSEANRLAVPHIAETNAILEALKNGTWQERSDTDIRCLAEEFIEAEWPRAKRDYTRWIASTFLNMDDYDPREADKVDHEMMVISLVPAIAGE